MSRNLYNPAYRGYRSKPWARQPRGPAHRGIAGGLRISHHRHPRPQHVEGRFLKKSHKPPGGGGESPFWGSILGVKKIAEGTSLGLWGVPTQPDPEGWGGGGADQTTHPDSPGGPTFQEIPGQTGMWWPPLSSQPASLPQTTSPAWWRVQRRMDGWFYGWARLKNLEDSFLSLPERYEKNKPET